MEATNQLVRAAKAAWDQAVLDLKTAPVRSDIDVEKYKLAVEEAELKYNEQLKQVALARTIADGVDPQLVIQSRAGEKRIAARAKQRREDDDPRADRRDGGDGQHGA